jgi:hypothetical protein
MLCHMILPFKNPCREKSSNMTSSCIVASLKNLYEKPYMKTHKAKRVQYDVLIGYCSGVGSP